MYFSLLTYIPIGIQLCLLFIYLLDFLLVCQVIIKSNNLSLIIIEQNDLHKVERTCGAFFHTKQRFLWTTHIYIIPGYLNRLKLKLPAVLTLLHRLDLWMFVKSLWRFFLHKTIPLHNGTCRANFCDAYRLNESIFNMWISSRSAVSWTISREDSNIHLYV